MPSLPRASIAFLLLGLLPGFLGCGEKPCPPENPQQRTLYASLWMETSGEYRALCYQTFRWAQERVTTALAALPPGSKPAAVVMDLDETVIDNAGYQTYLYRTGQVTADVLWQRWEREHANEVRPLPGALDFLSFCEKAGVRVFFVSNRRIENLEETLVSLKAAGFSMEGLKERVLLMPSGGSSDKEGRRQTIARDHTILLLMGDNLRDLSSEFTFPPHSSSSETVARQAIAARLTAVDKHRARFGAEWLVLPNPVYGEWTRPLSDHPEKFLHDTRMK